MSMNPGLFITVLCGNERDGWLAPALMERLFQALGESARMQRQVVIYFQKGASPVDRARNLGVEAFLASPCDWNLQLDNDTVPPPHFLKLIDEAEADGKSIVGAPCPFLADTGVAWNVGFKRGDRYEM